MCPPPGFQSPKKPRFNRVNLFMNDIFYFLDKSKLANYADICKKGIFPLLHALKSETEIVLNWFKINEMKSNSD